MGRAAREKREAREARSRALPEGPPKWAGAMGFDYAWSLNEGYLQSAEIFKTNAHGQMTYGEAAERGFEGVDARVAFNAARAKLDLLNYELDMWRRRSATLHAVAGTEPDEGEQEQNRSMEAYLPGDVTNQKIDGDWPYAEALLGIAGAHKKALERATPILFDPLAMPEVDTDSWKSVMLPFPAVTCDFLAQNGMSLPVPINANVKLGGTEAQHTHDTDQWVGLVAATMTQPGEGITDVFPVVSTLNAKAREDQQAAQRVLLHGMVRFGGELPEPPKGMTRLNLEDGQVSIWSISVKPKVPGVHIGEGDEDNDDDRFWAGLWVVYPALAALSALRLLEAVNVTLEQAHLDRPARRRAQREGAIPGMEVVIKRSATTDRAAADPSTVDWQHRWTVRGHWMHFTRGPIFNANPRKRIMDPVHGECVKVWCPPFVKGPADKPLVLKSRRVPNERTPA